MIVIERIKVLAETSTEGDDAVHAKRNKVFRLLTGLWADRNRLLSSLNKDSGDAAVAMPSINLFGPFSKAKSNLGGLLPIGVALDYLPFDFLGHGLVSHVESGDVVCVVVELDLVELWGVELLVEDLVPVIMPLRVRG